VSGPYAEAGGLYWAAGWRGVLPLPAGEKGPPPRGFTGWAGVDPSGADIYTWLDGPEAGGNIGLRLPVGIYGLDVDDYEGKTGGAALASLVEAYGPLPATWTVSSRDDSTSGIRLFNAELGIVRRWRDEPAGHGAGIEAVHFGHRYAVAWPSIHPDTGRKYVWRRPDGVLAGEGEIPAAVGLAPLPVAWVEGLSELGEVRTGDAAGHAETVAVVQGWRVGEPCPRVADAAGRAWFRLADARDGAALHPAARDATHELAALGHEGHAGVRSVLAQHYARFVEVRGGRGAAAHAAGDEWWRLVRGAVGKLVGTAVDECDCGLRGGDGVTFTLDDLGVERSPPASNLEEGYSPVTSGTSAVALEREDHQAIATRRVDLGPWLDGTYSPPQPTRGAERDDGVRLLYPGRWHSVVGLTGSGKSWLALLHARDEMMAWRSVVYLHFEEHSPAGTIDRLLALGVPRDVIAERFVWLECDRMWERGELGHELAGQSPGLVVLDGINAACTRHGFDPSSVEAVGWYRDRFVTPGVALDSAVLSLGHPPKAKDRQDERHGFGSTAWLDECDGVGFRLTASKTPIRRGAHGHAALHSVKDRYGSVESGGRADGGRDGWVYLGSLHVDNAGEDTTARLTMPSLLDPAGGTTDPLDALAAVVAAVMDTHGSAYQSERQLRGWLRAASVQFNDHDVDPALDRLETAGRIIRDPYAARRPRGARLCSNDLDGGDLNDD